MNHITKPTTCWQCTRRLCMGLHKPSQAMAAPTHDPLDYVAEIVTKTSGAKASGTKASGGRLDRAAFARVSKRAVGSRRRKQSEVELQQTCQKATSSADLDVSCLNDWDLIWLIEWLRWATLDYDKGLVVGFDCWKDPCRKVQLFIYSVFDFGIISCRFSTVIPEAELQVASAFLPGRIAESHVSQAAHHLVSVVGSVSERAGLLTAPVARLTQELGEAWLGLANSFVLFFCM